MRPHNGLSDPQDAERKAGVSHDIIRDALDETLAKHFIECVRRGRASAAGDSGDSALYALHRTDIPNEFFDRLIPHETISVINVVGALIRYSIGFQA